MNVFSRTRAYCPLRASSPESPGHARVSNTYGLVLVKDICVHRVSFHMGVPYGVSIWVYSTWGVNVKGPEGSFLGASNMSLSRGFVRRTSFLGASNMSSSRGFVRRTRLAAPSFTQLLLTWGKSRPA